jgi:hypothetical protein|tara:strand:- start:33 stop:311 length:279 start_codon:yes stop_codon:yes gene_type:complete
MKKTSQATKVISALESTDNGLTANEMKNRFGVVNARALVTHLRQNGFAIYLNKTPKYTDRNGNVRKGVSRYRLGTPSRAIIAAGYKALAASS